MSATLHPSSSRFAASWLALGLWLVAGCSSPSASVDAALDLGADQAVADARPDALGLDALPDIDESQCVGGREPLPAVPRDAPLVGRRGLAWETLIHPNSANPWAPAVFGDRIVLAVQWIGVVASDFAGKLTWIRPVQEGDFSSYIFPLGPTAAYATASGSLRLIDQLGQPLWQQDQLGPFTTLISSNIQATVRLSDGSTVVSTSGGRLTRVSRAGKIQWSKKLSGYAHALLRTRDDHLLVGGTRISLLTPRRQVVWQTRPPGRDHGTASALVPTATGQVVVAWSTWTSTSRKISKYLYLLDPSCGRTTLLATLPESAKQILVDDRDHLIVLGDKRIDRYRLDGSIAWTFLVPQDPFMVVESMLLGSDGSLYATTAWSGSPPRSRILQGSVETGQLKVVYEREDVRLRTNPVLLDGGLLVLGAHGQSSIPGSKTLLLGLRVSSPRLMQRGWPRFGGGNDNAFTFK